MALFTDRINIEVTIDTKKFDKIMQASNKLNKLDTATKKVTQSTRAQERVMGRRGKLIKEETNAQGILTKSYRKHDGTIRKYNNSTGKLISSQKKIKWGFLGISQSLGDVVSKFASWALIGGVMFGTVRMITNLVKGFVELDDIMGRVSTVARGFGDDFSGTMKMLKGQVLDYGKTSRASLMDSAKALYFLGTAGLSTTEIMAGHKHVMDMTVGTYGDINETGKLVAGMYNVFGKNIENANTAQEKFQYIADLLTFTYSNQQVELSEIESAMRLVGSAGAIMNVDIKTLIGTIGFLNSGLLKGCYDDETEILTNQGWKYFKDLNKTEKVATLNPETKELEYQKPYEYVDAPYKGKMILFSNKKVNLLVTPNHRMYVKSDKRIKKDYQIEIAENMYQKNRILKKNSKWNGRETKYFHLPSVENKTRTVNNIKIKMDHWLAFLGIWIAEGHATKGYNGNYDVVVTQKYGKTFNKMTTIMSKLPFNVQAYPKHKKIVITSKQLWSYLKQFGHARDKFIPREILQLSSRQLKIIYNSLMMGDGSKDKRIECGFRYHTSSKKLKDDFIELLLKIGLSGDCKKYILKHNNDNKDMYNIGINTFKNEPMLLSHQHKEIDYNGRQHCVSVPNELLYVRRNGKPVWCGNTRAGTSLMSTFLMIAKKSGKLKTEFGLIFDPAAPLDLNDMMEQLSWRFEGAALSVDDLRRLMDIFGLRGGRAVGAILNDFKKWEATVKTSDETFKDFAENTADKVENTLAASFKILGNAIQTDFIESLEDTKGPMKELIDSLIESQNRYSLLSKAMGLPAKVLVSMGGAIGDVMSTAMKETLSTRYAWKKRREEGADFQESYDYMLAHLNGEKEITTEKEKQLEINKKNAGVGKKTVDDKDEEETIETEITENLRRKLRDKQQDFELEKAKLSMADTWLANQIAAQTILENIEDNRGNLSEKALKSQDEMLAKLGFEKDFSVDLNDGLDDRENKYLEVTSDLETILKLHGLINGVQLQQMEQAAELGKQYKSIAADYMMTILHHTESWEDALDNIRGLMNNMGDVVLKRMTNRFLDMMEANYGIFSSMGASTVGRTGGMGKKTSIPKVAPGMTAISAAGIATSAGISSSITDGNAMTTSMEVGGISAADKMLNAFRVGGVIAGGLISREAASGFGVGSMMGGVFGPAGGAIGGVLGMIAGIAMTPEKENKQDEITKGWHEIAPKIDYTNKLLESISRDTSAMAKSGDPYAMPESYYFAENSLRGIQPI